MQFSFVQYRENISSLGFLQEGKINCYVGYRGHTQGTHVLGAELASSCKGFKISYSLSGEPSTHISVYFSLESKPTNLACQLFNMALLIPYGCFTMTKTNYFHGAYIF